MLLNVQGQVYCSYDNLTALIYRTHHNLLRQGL
jgi:hypothetical protein